MRSVKDRYGDAVAFKADRRFGITPHLSVEAHAAGADQFGSLGARAVPQF